MLEQFVGESGVLWDHSPAMAAVLLSTTPSGLPAIVDCREHIASAMPCPPVLSRAPRSLPTLKHISEPFHSYSNSCIYIGHGSTDCQGRPSARSNPYHFMDCSREQACLDFREYLSTRADLPEFLSHLEGMQLICDCPGDRFCHGNELISSFSSVFNEVEEIEDDKLDAFCAECVMEDFEEDDDSGAPDGLAPAPRFILSLEQVNETVRSGAARLDQERPRWLDSWVRIIWIIRMVVVLYFGKCSPVKQDLLAS